MIQFDNLLGPSLQLVAWPSATSDAVSTRFSCLEDCCDITAYVVFAERLNPMAAAIDSGCQGFKRSKLCPLDVVALGSNNRASR